MAKFKITLSEPETGKASSVELDGAKAKPFVGRELGEIVDGSLVGLAGKKIKITGGSDKDGIPLRLDVHGGGKKHLVLTRSVGFKGEKGYRERRLVRGRMISEETYQINLAVVKLGADTKNNTNRQKDREAEKTK